MKKVTIESYKGLFHIHDETGQALLINFPTYEMAELEAKNEGYEVHLLLTSAQMITVFSSNGVSTVNASTGKTMGWVFFHISTSAKIERFDLDEFRRTYKIAVGEPLPSNIDILDLGYWMDDGTYEPPVEDWRAEFRKSETGEYIFNAPRA